MAFECRMCGTPNKGPQGRGRHESFCVPKKGGRIEGGGANRVFITSDGNRIPAPNVKDRTPLSKKPKLVNKRGYSMAHNGESCTVCGKTDFPSITSFSGHQNHHVIAGEGKWKDGISRGAGKVLLQTKRGHDKYGDVSVSVSPLAVIPPVNHPSENTPEPISEEQQYSDEARMSHEAMLSLQKSAALLQFSLLMENVGPGNALAMLAGMSKFGKSLKI